MENSGKRFGSQKNYDSQDNEGVKKMKVASRLAPRNPGRKRRGKKQKELLIECGKLMINSGKMKDLTSYSFTNLS